MKPVNSISQGKMSVSWEWYNKYRYMFKRERDGFHRWFGCLSMESDTFEMYNFKLKYINSFTL